MKMIKRALVGISVMGLLACQGGEPEPPPPQRSTPAAAEPPVVEILRDQYGMPHIFASDNYGVYYGYGYALAQDRLYQMEILKRTVQGRVAEVLGEKFVALDTHIRSSYDLASVRDQLQALPAEQRQLLQAYADGFNRHIEAVLARPDSLMPKEFEDNGFKPELWRAYDVAMLFAGAVAHRYSDFNSERDNLALLQHFASKGDINRAWNIFSASKWLLDADSPTTVPAQLSVKQPEPTAPSYLQALPSLGQTRRVAIDKRGLFQGTTDKSVVAHAYNARLGREGFGFSPEFAPASNFWALANTRTQGAEGVLVNGPQFGWGLPSYVYGVALHGGDFDVVGNTLLGLPALLFAHNNHIAWGSTAGLSDQVDEYYLRLNPENPEQYWHDGRYKNFKSWPETIKVKGAEPLTITARRAEQGMVLMHQPEQGLAVARARAWEGKELASLMAWVELSKRKSVAEAKVEVGKVATNINFYYMDKAGNIAYTHAGRYPVRAAGHDPRIPAPGDGRWDWRGLRSYQENPTVENPEQGYIANWNNRPARGWPASDLWPLSWGRADRNQLLDDQLAGDKKMTAAEVWQVNRAVSFADVNLPFLLPHLKAAMLDAKLNDVERVAYKLLLAWDRQWLASEQGVFAAGPAILEQWLSTVLEDVFKDDIGPEYFYLYSATATPAHQLGASMHTGPGTKALIKNLDALAAGRAPIYDFFNGKPAAELLRRSFQKAVRKLQAEQGMVPRQWQLAAAPMVWQAVNFRGVPQADASAQPQVKEYMNRGSENNLFIATGNGFEAFDSVPPGQSGFIAPDGEPSEHYRDQMEMFKAFEHKRLPFTRAELEQTAVRAQKLTLSTQ